MPQLNNMLLLWLLNIFYVVAVSDTNPVGIQKGKNSKDWIYYEQKLQNLKRQKAFLCVRNE